jgi:hypothetical protein
MKWNTLKSEPDQQMKGVNEMDSKIKLTIRTATRDRQADISAPPEATIREILGSAKENWNLSGDYEYVVRCERLGTQLVENESIQQAGIQEGDILEIQPLADAGE